jgi:hypothetical protein
MNLNVAERYKKAEMALLNSSGTRGSWSLYADRGLLLLPSDPTSNNSRGQKGIFCCSLQAYLARLSDHSIGILHFIQASYSHRQLE